MKASDSCSGCARVALTFLQAGGTHSWNAAARREVGTANHTLAKFQVLIHIRVLLEFVVKWYQT
jgi:hypothetical protein